MRHLGSAAAIAALLLGGCGGGGDDPAPGSEPASTSPPSEATESPSSSASSTPSVAPAKGRLVRLPGASVRAPEGWTLTKLVVVQGWEARDPDAFGSVFLYQPRAPVTTLDGLIEMGALDDYQGKPKVSFDAELGGEPAFRAVGKDSIGHLVTYGAVRGNTGMELAFGIDEYISAKERKRIEESVVATFEWR